MILDRGFFGVAWFIASITCLSVGSGFGADIPFRCPDLLGREDTLKRGISGTLHLLRTSPNYKPISKIAMEYYTAIEKEVVVEVGKEGSLVLTNDLGGGTSILEWVDRGSGSREVLFDAGKIPEGVPSRIDSVAVSADRTRLIVYYRDYAHGFPRLLKYETALENPAVFVSLAKSRSTLIWNYRETSAIDVPQGRISVRDYGLNASVDAIFIPKKGEPRIFFSSFERYRNGSEAFSDLSLSPNGDFVVIRTSLNGSIDQFQIRVYERRTLKLLKMVTAGDEHPVWRQSRMNYSTPLENGVARPLSESFGAPKSIPFSLTPARPADFGTWLGTQGSKVVYVTKPRVGKPFELRIQDSDRGLDSLLVVEEARGYSFDNVSLMGDVIVLHSRKLEDRQLFLYDLNGVEIARIQVPESASIADVSWLKEGKSLHISFWGDVNSGLDVVYDLKARTFAPADFVDKLRTDSEGREYVSEIVYYPSKDGMKIPMRMAYRRGLARDAKTPVLMTVYGGFGVVQPGFLPIFDPMISDFLKRGGIAVWPALRGGGENGQGWHEAGRNLQKEKTLEDTVAAADYLIAERFTQPGKIIVTGASNGGFVSAAAGLMGPRSFGLVIPVAGLFDLVRTETLDSDRLGWPDETGSNKIPAEMENKKRLSPLENVSHLKNSDRLPEYLIVGGRNDSRVNPYHSQEFYLQLARRNTSPSGIGLIQPPHSGHFASSPQAARIIGWSTYSLIWTRIYDFLGWKF